MNSLEFIENFIKHAEEEIEYFKKRIEEDAIYPSLKQCNELELESAIKANETLYQIKTELEAWEVVKKHLDYFSADYWNGITEEGIAMTSFIDCKEEGFETLKKALEVKDER